MNKRYNNWQELIEAKTRQQGDCLIWEAGTHTQGYPMVRWDNKMVQVVRRQMELKTGEKLDGLRQRVKNRVCGNPLCVNPDHYIIANQGTEEWKCVNFKYDEEMREALRKEYWATPRQWNKSKRLKAKYGVSHSTFYKIVHEKKS